MRPFKAEIIALREENEKFKEIAIRYDGALLAVKQALLEDDSNEAYHQIYIGLWDEPSYKPDAAHTILAAALSEQEEKE